MQARPRSHRYTCTAALRDIVAIGISELVWSGRRDSNPLAIVFRVYHPVLNR